MWKNWMILNLHKNYLWSRPRRQWTAWPYLMSGSRTHHVLLLQSAGSPRFPCGVSRPGNHGNRYHLHFHQNCRYFNTTQQSMGPSNGPPSLWPVATWCRRWYRSKNEVVVVNTCYIDYWGFPRPGQGPEPRSACLTKSAPLPLSQYQVPATPTGYYPALGSEAHGQIW